MIWWLLSNWPSECFLFDPLSLLRFPSLSLDHPRHAGCHVSVNAMDLLPPLISHINHLFPLIVQFLVVLPLLSFFKHYVYRAPRYWLSSIVLIGWENFFGFFGEDQFRRHGRHAFNMGGWCVEEWILLFLIEHHALAEDGCLCSQIMIVALHPLVRNYLRYFWKSRDSTLAEIVIRVNWGSWLLDTPLAHAKFSVSKYDWEGRFHVPLSGNRGLR